MLQAPSAKLRSPHASPAASEGLEGPLSGLGLDAAGAMERAVA